MHIKTLTRILEKIVLGIVVYSAFSSDGLKAQALRGRQTEIQPGDPLPGLSAEERARFVKGKMAFETVENVEDGIGPVFNERSCVDCHNGPAPGGGAEIFGVRFGRIRNGQYDDMQAFGGPTLQNQGIGLFNGVNFVGETVPAEATVVARRRANPMFGYGLVDHVPDEFFYQLAQRQKRVSPETAGRVNVTINFRTGRPAVGKFGWKGDLATLYDFAADAYKDELGVTTAGFTRNGNLSEVFEFARSRDGRSVSEENPPQGNTDLLKSNPAGSPNEPDDTTLLELEAFMTMLAPPPRGTVSRNTLQGQRVFQMIGCTNCHLPALRTGPSEIRALNRVQFQPYSDFLLHDMGALGDGVGGSGENGSPKGSEMRTAPLWGLRFQNVYLHDGRAKSLHQAILMHDGQGLKSQRAYSKLPNVARLNLMEFLNSL
ncbi:MAG: hypothetical protein RJA81_2229 [Planctomycetota bacterium]|jgi:CxxC motif-containing protein (DUF1111 family)